jgi:hypothetical protein
VTSLLLSLERPTTQRPINVIDLLRNAATIWSFGNCTPETSVFDGQQCAQSGVADEGVVGGVSRGFLADARPARLVVPSPMPISFAVDAQEQPLPRRTAILEASTTIRGRPSFLPLPRRALERHCFQRKRGRSSGPSLGKERVAMLTISHGSFCGLSRACLGCEPVCLRASLLDPAGRHRT